MREAVKALVMARVLEIRRGDGTYVTGLEPGVLLEGLGSAVELLRSDTLCLGGPGRALAQAAALMHVNATEGWLRRRLADAAAAVPDMLDDRGDDAGPLSVGDPVLPWHQQAGFVPVASPIRQGSRL